MTKTGEMRALYSDTIERHPSRFDFEGKPYAKWAARADAWAAEQCPAHGADCPIWKEIHA